METDKLFFEKKIIITAIIYFLLSGIILYTYGIQLGGEAEKYIDNAHRILNKQELRNGVFGFFYLAYSLLVAFFVKFSVNLVAVAIVQVLLSFIAALFFYKLLFETLGNKTAAFIFLVAYLLCYPVQKWNFYLYSESLHNSLLVIGVYLFNKWVQERKFSRLMTLVAIVLLILFSRPAGVLFLMSLFAVLMVWLYRNKKQMQFYLLAGISIASVIVILNSPLTAFVNPDSIRRMEVICQVPETNADAGYQEFNRQGLNKALAVIKDEIGLGSFIKNGAKKLGYFFGMYRSYYSWQNNLLLICFTAFYFFAIIGIFSKQSKAYFCIKLFSIFYLLFTITAVFFTCDDWANRFIAPAFPFILVLAAGGTLKALNKIRNSDNSN